MMISRNSSTECSSSGKIRANGSANTVIDSSNETPCLTRFASALFGSHSNRRDIFTHVNTDCGTHRQIVGYTAITVIDVLGSTRSIARAAAACRRVATKVLCACGIRFQYRPGTACRRGCEWYRSRPAILHLRSFRKAEVLEILPPPVLWPLSNGSKKSWAIDL